MIHNLAPLAYSSDRVALLEAIKNKSSLKRSANLYCDIDLFTTYCHICNVYMVGFGVLVLVELDT